VKRAGLDYWESVQLRVWDDFEALEAEMKAQPHEMAALSKTGHLPFWELPKGPQRLFLVFGSETEGLPDPIRSRFSPAQTFHIPIRSDIRSLNLSTAVGIALYESLRKGPLFHAWQDSAKAGRV
jgi:tRNA (cytidine/uridine-2'-O-)-methyltransferase